MFHSIIENLQNDLDFEQLVDIRENSAYVAFVQLIGGYINFEEDGYEILAKEYKRELKYSGGNLMALQLREIVDKSIVEITKFFEGFCSFKTFQKLFNEVEKVKIKTKKRHVILQKIGSAYQPNVESNISDYNTETGPNLSNTKIEYDHKENMISMFYT